VVANASGFILSITFQSTPRLHFGEERTQRHFHENLGRITN